MRLSLLAAAALAVAVPARAQTARASADVPVARHSESVYVVPHGAGEAVRVTTFARRPSVGARLDRYRGVRVFRGPAVAPAAVRGVPASRVLTTPDGRYVRQGGATYPVTRR